MLVLHDYPLSMVDHLGFRRFVAALQPLFKLHTRNTIRGDIVGRYKTERKKAIEYMSMIQSRVVVTTDMWISDSQKKGYMAITAHFIDGSWRLRTILMRFIYVPAPHNAAAIARMLHESLVEWNLDEKLLTVTVDNCNVNDKAVEEILGKIGKNKYAHIAETSFWTCLQDIQEGMQGALCATTDRFIADASDTDDHFSNDDFFLDVDNLFDNMAGEDIDPKTGASTATPYVFLFSLSKIILFKIMLQFLL
ncbi:zinc finger BED domain-containing protein RICESLEEPER 3-like [Triticum dicoccoides]|uniref:zinc finger BED domain-containing protein RICESLEEPER 3-like n=1 Tax=Triticum dicoccoides TaxID=85692 RepID=UPI001890E0A1|nr:zinc finger BED domain-containing protein RICESLEEPER 3-like [Triticum dicoccoides]